MSRSPGEIQSLKKAFHIVELLRTHGELGVTQVAEKTGMSNSSAHRYLKTLSSLGLVTPSADGYEIGLRFLEYGNLARERLEPFPFVRQKIDRLAEETGERSWCIVEENLDAVFVYGAAGEYTEADIKPGCRLPLHSTAAGKAILAHSPDHFVDRYLESVDLTNVTDHTITDPETLLRELKRVRSAGYAVNLEESDEGLHAISAPVCPQSGSPVCSITIAGPAQRLDEDRCRSTLSHHVTSVANEVQLDLSYS